MVRVELLCLGTGKASTHIYYGEPSTGFVIIQDGEPVLLMGAGLGIVRSCVYYCKKVPDTIYISHNHSDHAGELPLLLSVEAGKGRRKKVVAETQVMTRILNHRLGEYHESIELSNRKLSDLADFVDCPEQEMTSVTANLSIIPYRSQHSERCFGFVLFYMNRPILGWSSDSGFEPNFYQQISTQTPVLILDARQTGSYDHAAFDDVIEFERKLAAACDAAGVTRTAIYVTVYGTQAEVPTNPQALKIGQTLMLFEDFEPAPPGVVSNGQHPPSASLHNLNNGFSSSYPAAPTEPVRQETSVLHSPVRQGGYSQPYSQSHHSNPPQHNFVPQQGPVSPTLSARSQPRGRSIPRNSAQQRSSDIRNLLHHISDTDPRASEAGSRGYSYSIPGQRSSSLHSIKRFPAPEPLPSKVFVHSNENKGAPPKLYLLKNVRTLDQLKLKVSDGQNIKPIKHLHQVDGTPIRSLSQITHMMEVIATKHAGSPFDVKDLPIHVKVSGAPPGPSF